MNSTPTGSTDSDNSIWSDDIESVLDNIRKNSAILSSEHKKEYIRLKGFLKFFRLPVIILSGINSVFSIGLNNYLNQGDVSLITCLISLTCGIITSVELYLGLQKSMDSELTISRDFYLLSIDIYKTLQLKRENRNIDGSAYLDSCLSTYSKLFENSNVLTKSIKDELVKIDVSELAVLASISNEIDYQMHGPGV